MPSMAFHTGEEVDTVIVGNGPSALILSYILHGNIPYYNGGFGDRILDQKLRQSENLLHVAPDVLEYLRSSPLYSSQALPINALLDVLIRPQGDASNDFYSCVEWRFEPNKALKHIVIGNTEYAGGQWVDNPVKASWEIGTLSYAEQLSLPGFGFPQYWQATKAEPLPELIHPTRTDVAKYLKAYPEAVGIAGSIRTSTNISNIYRDCGVFHVDPLNIKCKHLVLASGVFNINLPPPRFLNPLISLASDNGPVLVIGSGFSAADVIISTAPHRKITHIYNWDPEHHPSPLKAGHSSAYPEYAWVYRQMRLAADRLYQKEHLHIRPLSKRPRQAPNSSLPSFSQRDWSATYEGLPNSRVISIASSSGSKDAGTGDAHENNDHRSWGVGGPHRPSRATVEIGIAPTGRSIVRDIACFQYVTGRRGSLSYLNESLAQEVIPGPAGKRAALVRRDSKEYDFATNASPATLVSSHTLRPKIEGLLNAADSGRPDQQPPAAEASRVRAAGLELAPGVFAVGSLTGDSLVRFAYGGCTAVAGTLLGA